MADSIADIVTACLRETEKRYGTGNNDGETPRKYHNRAHVETVISDSLAIGRLSLEHHKITPRALDILHIAAAFHDFEQNAKDETNEVESADLMEKFLVPTNIFNQDELLEARETLLGTECVWVKGLITQPFAHSFLAQVLADADLAHLGKATDVFIKTERALLDELSGLSSPRGDEKAFWEETLLLLQNHRFFTPEAEFLFSGQDKNILYVKEQLRKF